MAMSYTDVEKTEMLISEIQKHTVLWNKKNKKYRDRLITGKAWAEVSEVTGNLNCRLCIQQVLYVEALSNVVKCDCSHSSVCTKHYFICS